jgi:hypothetical protein
MSLTLAISLHELLTARGIEWQSMWMSDWRQFRLETGTHQVDTGQHVAILQDHWLELYSEQTIELSMLQWVKQQRSQQPALLWQMTPNRPKAEDLHPEPREHAQWLQRLQPLLKWSDDQWQQMSYLADTTQQELLQSNQANDLHPNCRDREPANPKDFYPGWPLYRKDHIDYRWDKEPI